MQFIVTAEEMKEYDNNTITHIGVPGMVLMERAALQLKEVICKHVHNPQTMLIVTGVGNNGGDGLALARLFSREDCDVTVCRLENLNKETESFRTQRKILEHYSVEILEEEKALETLKEFAKVKAGFDVVVDAVFGVGLSRPLSGSFAEAVAAMNAIRGYKVAADIPSGICANTGKVLGCAFKADLTVTFGFAKRGLYLYPGTDYVGQLAVADIGIAEQSFMGRIPKVFTYRDTPCKYLPKRANAGNKGTFGKVLLIGGFEKMTGAAILSAKAIFRSGAGMVKVLLPSENRSILQTSVPEVMCGDFADIKSSLAWADVVAIGPGLGKSAEAIDILKQVLECSDLPLVTDADALNIISADCNIKVSYLAYKGVKIMTPHMGEWSRLSQMPISELKEDLFENVTKTAVEYQAIVVCKDARTLVAHPDGRIYLNTTGNNGMATAGSGDALTGIVAGLLAQNNDAFTMASLAVYLHGMAGDTARDIYTEYGVTAGRIVDNIRVE